MSDPDQPPTPDRLRTVLEEANHEKAATCLDRLGTADAETRKHALRAAREIAEERPHSFQDLADQCSAFLTDDDRAVRLTAAKLFVALSASEPAVVLSAVDALAGRLADEDEFYFVRARCAEALGYVAIEAPDEVADPETLADLRLGLAFDEPEVKEKLAKALAHVALGDPNRLRHHASSLAEHLDDEAELVRYYLCTALVVVGCAYPDKLAGAAGPLQARLDDANPYVVGRAAEAIGLLATSPVSVEWDRSLDDIETDHEDPPAFLIDRLSFCRQQLAPEQSGEAPDEVGTIASIRDEIDDVVEEMTASDDGSCPHCGLDLPEGGPPMCPQCGAPR
ncbi:HEAT repeat domain-containing protein [Halobellus rubicundus]|uniref:HEAT repeat domain-containing protein n=1 Tax=Halobellus rubicundus TaxID=2996466 RepID=A0ABD5MGU8_9EURY